MTVYAEQAHSTSHLLNYNWEHHSIPIVYLDKSHGKAHLLNNIPGYHNIPIEYSDQLYGTMDQIFHQDYGRNSLHQEYWILGNHPGL